MHIYKKDPNQSGSRTNMARFSAMSVSKEISSAAHFTPASTGKALDATPVFMNSCLQACCLICLVAIYAVLLFLVFLKMKTKDVQMLWSLLAYHPADTRLGSWCSDEVPSVPCSSRTSYRFWVCLFQGAKPKSNNVLPETRVDKG